MQRNPFYSYVILLVMKEKYLDFIVIILIVVLLITLNKMEVLEIYAKFSFIPLIALYYLGKYIGVKRNKEEAS